MEQEIQGKVVVKTKKESIISLFKAGVKEIAAELCRVGAPNGGADR